MRESGAKMVEVGTTNKTHLRDYENAITPRTGLMLKVHSSNYRVVGFTEEVPLVDLVALGAKHGVPVFEDQGSGVLVDLAPVRPARRAHGGRVHRGRRRSGDARRATSSSADRRRASSPASADVIAKLKKHPLARARAPRQDDARRARGDAAALPRPGAPVRRGTHAPHAHDDRRGGEEARRSPRRGDPLRGRRSLRGRDRADVSRAGGGALPMEDIPTTVVALTLRGA